VQIALTPVSQIDGLWIKRDDQTNALYGGNKPRKLGAILDAARQAGASKLLTLGAAGSHHVLATALFGTLAGFEVHAVMVPQVYSEHVSLNMRTSMALGAVVHPSANYLSATLRTALLACSRDVFFVTLGGSSALGSLGYVDAALELEQQIVRGELPEPDEIVVALGSGGTAAGLACGLALTKLRTRVVGVAIATPPWALRMKSRRLIRQIAKMRKQIPVRDALARFSVERGYVGAGYGHPTEAAHRALAWAKEGGLKLDLTYTAKACAYALEAQKTKRVLYWHTLSESVPKQNALSEVLTIAQESELPATYRFLLIRP
jgi:1-aminocyclopropane-1-carboxylate deaminase/D-cysteine desulfhydrase-like pyridoxal-dependent ACC family enzyme